MLYSHLRLGLPSCLFSFRSPHQSLYTPLLSPTRATCPTHLIILDSITRIIFGGQYRLRSYSLYGLLQSTVTSSLLDANIFLSALFSVSVPSSMPDTKFHTHMHPINFKRRIKSHLPFAGIIRSSPYSPRFQDNG